MFADYKTRTPKFFSYCLVTVAATVVHSAISTSSTISGSQVTRQRETFDVASIRLSESGSIGSRTIRQQPSGLNATNATTLDLIKFAFDVIERDVVGEVPNWVKTTRFDLTARTANGPLTPRRVRALTRALLEDRFRLDASTETADGRVYALVTVRPGGTDRLRRSESTCQVDPPLSDAVERRTPVRVLDLSARCGFSIVSSSETLSGLFGTRVTMQELAAQLSRVGGFDLPVVDRTGLNGEFDVAVAPQADIVAPTSQARFLIALREQAGLILEPERGSFEVLRIRRIEQPSPN